MLRNLLIFIFRKEKETMAMIYVSLIIKGLKTFKDVPFTLTEQVRQILIDIDCEHLIIEWFYSIKSVFYSNPFCALDKAIFSVYSFIRL